MQTYGSSDLRLKDVIDKIKRGKIQLPDFQRDWVWDDEHVKSLLISIAQSFPIGAIMMLETGGDVQFQARPLENVGFDSDNPNPEKLILDGQQRLTSLTQALGKTPVKTFDQRGRRINRHYYIDISLALNSSRLEEAFVSIPEDRKIKTNFNRDIKLDLSSRYLEIKHFYFPCSEILDYDVWEDDLLQHAQEKFPEFKKFRRQFLYAYRDYEFVVIELKKDISKEAICSIFEKVNTGGVTLSIFELMTAIFAAHGGKLREDWFGDDRKEIKGIRNELLEKPILEGVEPVDFLQAISILRSYEHREIDIKAGKKGNMISAVSAKRATILSLSLCDYNRLKPTVVEGFRLAARFMEKQHFFKSGEIPYRTQLVPLAAILSKLKERWLEPKIYDRLSCWFWCGVLGELYGGATETRIANDFEELMPWLNSEDAQAIDLPRTIADAAFQESRLDTLRTRNSAAYKGINALVLREGARDFFWKESIQKLDREDVSLDIHHIFPRAWCEANGIRREHYNSIVNKTPISYKANRMIGGKAPSLYLSSIQNHSQVGLNDEEMDDILSSHKIPFTPLRNNDFTEHYKQRKENLLKIIEMAMGKTAQRDQSNNTL